MQKHVRHQLPQAKMAVGRIPERAGVYHPLLSVGQQQARDKGHNVHDQQGGDRSGHAIHEAIVAILRRFATQQEQGANRNFS